MVYAFPYKIEAASAGFARVVAIVEEPACSPDRRDARPCRNHVELLEATQP